ncbi:hypothetical protein BH23PLA1_BH23PLA1_01000 [soil metagenome]
MSHRPSIEIEMDLIRAQFMHDWAYMRNPPWTTGLMVLGAILAFRLGGIVFEPEPTPDQVSSSRSRPLGLVVVQEETESSPPKAESEPEPRFDPAPLPLPLPEPESVIQVIPATAQVEIPPPPPPLPPALPGVDEGRFLDPTQQRIESFQAPDLDIRRALEILDRQSAFNIVVSPAVGGRVVIDLQDVTFQQALDVVLKAGNLVYRQEGTILYIYTHDELTAIEARGRAIGTRIYHLNYIRALDLELMIGPFLSPEVGVISMTPPSQMGIGSPSAGVGVGAGLGGAPPGVGGAVGGPGGGGIAIGTGVGAGAGQAGNTGGNSLAGADSVIVRDFEENLRIIDEIVAHLDVQPLQVVIEAVVLSVELRDNQDLGVNFGLVNDMATAAVVSGSGAAINAAAGFSPAQVLSTLNQPIAGVRPGGLVPGLAAPNQGLKFGFVDQNISVFVSALERTNKVDILASPRVLVLNKQQANIQLGQQLGYSTTFTNLTQASQIVQFIPVGTLLSLRPFVSSDGMVRLEIHPERSSGFIDPAGIPQLNTNEMTTNILIPDGATVVIGGLIDREQTAFQEGVLGLSRLPMLGPLFRFRNLQERKTELIVLLTPRILTPAGLPPPKPGYAPIGPLGVPNSGPMPGPPARIHPEALPPPPPFAPDGAGSFRIGPGSSWPLLGRGSADIEELPPLPPDFDPAIAPTTTPDPPAVAAPPTAALPAGFGLHETRLGERFEEISRLYYGSSRFRDALRATNRDRIAPAMEPRPGQSILIPPAGRLDPALIDPDPDPASEGQHRYRPGNRTRSLLEKFRGRLGVAGQGSLRPPG